MTLPSLQDVLPAARRTSASGRTSRRTISRRRLPCGGRSSRAGTTEIHRLQPWMLGYCARVLNENYPRLTAQHYLGGSMRYLLALAPRTRYKHCSTSSGTTPNKSTWPRSVRALTSSHVRLGSVSRRFLTRLPYQAATRPFSTHAVRSNIRGVESSFQLRRRLSGTSLEVDSRPGIRWSFTRVLRSERRSWLSLDLRSRLRVAGPAYCISAMKNLSHGLCSVRSLHSVVKRLMSVQRTLRRQLPRRRNEASETLRSAILTRVHWLKLRVQSARLSRRSSSLTRYGTSFTAATAAR